MLARERIEMVLDQDSTFLELLPLAGMERKGGFGAGGTNVSGTWDCGGDMHDQLERGYPKGSVDAQQFLRDSNGDITRENKLPTINLVESGGANLPDQAKIFNYGGEAFREITRRSAMGLTTISVVFGNATAGGAYVPGMSDFAISKRKPQKCCLIPISENGYQRNCQ